VADWIAFFGLLESQTASWPGDFLRKQFKADEFAALLRIAEEYRRQSRVLFEAQEILDQRDKFPAAAIEAAHQAADGAKQALSQALQKKMPRLNIGAAELVQKVLNSLLQDPNFWNANANSLETIAKSAGHESRDAIRQIREMLRSFGVAEIADGLSFRLKPLIAGEAPFVERLTRYEQGLVERLNAVALSGLLFPGIIQSGWRENYVDYRIASSKEWRDIYRYSPDGTMTGWRRYQPAGITEFNAEGLMVVDKDAQGRCLRGRVVRYELEPDKRDPNNRRTKAKLVATEAMREYEYKGTDDWKGHPRK
jgi:hypothetical protein